MTTQVYPQARPLVQESLPNEALHRQEIARVLNLAMRGQTNNGMTITLTPSATSTTIIDERISIQTAVHLVPATANAATAAASVFVVPTAGQAVLHHASNAATDQIFAASLVG